MYPSTLVKSTGDQGVSSWGRELNPALRHGIVIEDRSIGIDKTTPLQIRNCLEDATTHARLMLHAHVQGDAKIGGHFSSNPS